MNDLEDFVEARYCPWCAVSHERIEPGIMELREPGEPAFALCPGCARSLRGRLHRLGVKLATWVRVAQVRFWYRLRWLVLVGKQPPHRLIGAWAAYYALAPNPRTGKRPYFPNLRSTWWALTVCRRFGHLVDGTEIEFGFGPDTRAATAYCARCDFACALTASEVRQIRSSGGSPELFDLLDAEGWDPLRPSQAVDGDYDNDCDAATADEIPTDPNLDPAS